MKILREHADPSGWSWQMGDDWVLRGRSPTGEVTTASKSIYSPLDSRRLTTTFQIEIFDRGVPRPKLSIEFDTHSAPAEYAFVRDLASVPPTH